MITGENIVTEALKYIGTPFVHQGRTDTGLDCAGLVFRAHSPYLPEITIPSNYARQPSGNMMAKQLQECGFSRITGCGTNYTDDQFTPGLIILMRFESDPQHVGITSNIDGHVGIVHSYKSAGGVVEHSLSQVWRSRIVSMWYHPKIDYKAEK